MESITRGISTSDATASTQGLPSVNPVYTWVRLAQRVPVRIRITDVPPGIPLVAGMTLTISLDSLSYDREGRGLAGVRHLIDGWLRPDRQPRTGCDIATPVTATIERLPEAKSGFLPSATEINPTLAPAMATPPGPHAINPP